MKKVLLIIGGIVLGLVILGVIIFMVISGSSKKLVCKSNDGDITIMYNEKTLTGYKAVGVGYDFDGQKEIAEQMGVDAYIDDFDEWFRTNTTGTCTKK